MLAKVHSCAVVGLDAQTIHVEVDIASGQPLWSYHSSFDIAPYLERHKIKAKTTRAMQRLWGIYYVSANEFHAAGLGN